MFDIFVVPVFFLSRTKVVVSLVTTQVDLEIPIYFFHAITDVAQTVRSEAVA